MYLNQFTEKRESELMIHQTPNARNALGQGHLGFQYPASGQLSPNE